MLGGPFYTSVPCGRVGSKQGDEFRNNDEFVHNLRRRERADRAVLNSKLGEYVSRVRGVASLRDSIHRRRRRLHGHGQYYRPHHQP